MSLFSLDLERTTLGGFINSPEVLAEVDGFLEESAFTQNEHQVIYTTIRQIIYEKKDFNKVFLIHRIKSLGIIFKGSLDIGDYIDSISFNKMSVKALIQNSKELIKLKFLRDTEAALKNISLHINQNKTDDLNKIIPDIDQMYSSTISNLADEDGPVNIFDGLESLILERGNNPKDEVGLKVPFGEYTKLFGELRDANVYAIASRPKEGKTTFLNYIGHKVSELNGVPVLFLDTEMMTEEIQFRIAASFTDIPLWYIETGNWNKNVTYREKMLEALKKIKKLPVFHESVGNKTIDEVISLARRWHLKYVGRGNKCLIIYDYLKLTGEKIGQNWAEYQAIGEKTNKLKSLSKELMCPIFTAIQINRTGISTGKGKAMITDDSSVIAQSDRIMWFVTFLAIFRRKVAEEIMQDGLGFGTHKMIKLAARYEGRDATGHQSLIQRKSLDGGTELVENFINFKVDNFKVTELGTLKDIILKENPMIAGSDLRSEVEEETL